MAHVTLFNFSAEQLIPDSLPVVGGDGMPLLVPLQGAWFYGFNDTDEEAVITPRVKMPGQYAGGTLMATVWGCFASEVTATDEAVLDVSVEAITQGDGVDMDAGVSFDAVNSGEIDPPGTAGHEAAIDITLTNKDSVAAGDYVRFHVRRDCDGGADTATGDFRLGGIEIWEST